MKFNQNLLNEKYLIFYSNEAQPMTAYELTTKSIFEFV